MYTVILGILSPMEFHLQKSAQPVNPAEAARNPQNIELVGFGQLKRLELDEQNLHMASSFRPTNPSSIRTGPTLAFS